MGNVEKKGIVKAKNFKSTEENKNYDYPNQSKPDPQSQKNSTTKVLTNQRTLLRNKKILIDPKKNDLSKDLDSEYNTLEVLKEKNFDDTDHELIEKCLLKHYFMKLLDNNQRNEIIKEMCLCKVKKNQVIFHQGQVGNFFYIIREGEVKLYIDKKEVSTLKGGDSFGELALLHGSLRSGTMISSKESLLWCLERKIVRKIIENINYQNYKENLRFINKIHLFSNLDNKLKTSLAKDLLKVYYEPGQVIVREGDLSSCLYIIKEGEVDCKIKNKYIRTLKDMDYFGEKSILLQSKRTMSCIAKNKCICYIVTVESLKNLLGEKYNFILLFNCVEVAFQESQYLNQLNPKLFKNAFQLFKLKDYSQDEIVVPKGHIVGSVIYLILEGGVSYKKKFSIGSRYDNSGQNNEERVDFEYKKGKILFEKEIINYDPKSQSKIRLKNDLCANPDCLAMIFDTYELMKVLESNFKEIFNQSTILTSLTKIPVFMNISHEKLSILARKICTVKFEDNQRIIKQGEIRNEFYIVKKGTVLIYKNNKYIRTISNNESFGYKSLFNNKARSADAIAKGECECFVLSGKVFCEIIEDNQLEYLRNKMMLEDDEVSLEDLIYIKDLGSGSYGNVCLVQSRRTKFLYAIKAINKKQIDYEKIHTNIEQEKNILLKIDHPFITKLVKTLKNDKQTLNKIGTLNENPVHYNQNTDNYNNNKESVSSTPKFTNNSDEKYVFFLMEFNKGKELWDVIRDIGLLNRSETQFYIASILIAIDYLHSINIVHRDLKPENIMILDNGYMKLIDFGTCKEIEDKTHTIIGTPHYMAPEIILGDGYGLQVDYWSIGILLYEFVCGGVPYGEGSDNPLEVYRLVVRASLKFPNFVNDWEFIDLAKKMLSKNPLSRICSFNKIKNHPYFNGFSFEKLANFGITPPYVVKNSKIDYGNENKSYIEHIKTFKKFPHNVFEGNKDYNKWYNNF